LIEGAHRLDGGRRATTSAAPATFRPEVVVGGEITRVLVEQLRAVNIGRLDERVAHLTPEEQRAVDDSLELVLGL
jgi:mRNA interferase MazF